MVAGQIGVLGQLVAKVVGLALPRKQGHAQILHLPMAEMIATERNLVKMLIYLATRFIAQVGLSSKHCISLLHKVILFAVHSADPENYHWY